MKKDLLQLNNHRMCTSNLIRREFTVLLRNERFSVYYSNQQDIHFCIFSIISYDMVDVNNRKKVLMGKIFLGGITFRKILQVSKIPKKRKNVSVNISEPSFRNIQTFLMMGFEQKVYHKIQLVKSICNFSSPQK